MPEPDLQLARHFRDRAEGFLRGMNFLFAVDVPDSQADDFKETGASAAALAVHSAIALADAVLAVTGVKRSDRKDHMTLIKDLKAACTKQNLPSGEKKRGADHLRALLKMKSHFEYGTASVKRSEVLDACRTCRRFNSWAYENFALSWEK